MNREIKFRVWDKERKEFIEWLNADPMIQCASGALLCWERTQNKDGSYGEDIIVNKPEFSNNLVIQQFTGIKDKNDKEIYEGDIIKCAEIDNSFPGTGKPKILQNFKAVVTWNNTLLEYDYNPINKSGYNFPHQQLCYAWNIEIIGNIFENPELLKHG